jgi:hypothetical protein
VGYPIFLTLIGFIAWDSLRVRGEPWFRWLAPTGVTSVVIGIYLLLPPLIAVGIVITTGGIGVSKRWREKNDRGGKWFS